jgi:hypothetical protein
LRRTATLLNQDTYQEQKLKILRPVRKVQASNDFLPETAKLVPIPPDFEHEYLPFPLTHCTRGCSGLFFRAWTVAERTAVADFATLTGRIGRLEPGPTTYTEGLRG